MILQPAILALLSGSLLTSLLMVFAGWQGVLILARWDISSGSELQLHLERKTYLVSSILVFTSMFQVLSLFFYIAAADQIHGLFTGVMCAAGTLNVNGYGYPVLVLKLVTAMLAGIWLIINHLDAKGFDYPLIKTKYTLLLVIIPLLLLETLLQFRFFSAMKADLITSCCGSLFSGETRGIAGELAGIPAIPSAVAFYLATGATMASGCLFLQRGEGSRLFSLLSSITFCIAGAALIAVFCLYFYDLPTHHCPFCLLQREYGHVGFVLYATLLAGGITGMGPGIVASFRARPSLVRAVPLLQRQLIVVTMAMYLLFALVVTWRMQFSTLRLGQP
jgi:hypothetical protein